MSEPAKWAGHESFVPITGVADKKAFWQGLVGGLGGLLSFTAIGAALAWVSRTAIDKYMGIVAANQTATFKHSLDEQLQTFKYHLDEQLQSLKAKLETEQAAERLVFEKLVAFKAQQLSEFYWPIYIRLQKDNAVWQRVLGEASDRFSTEIGAEIERNVILPNHDEIAQIIQTKFHLAQKDDKLEQSLLQYIRHVAVYRALRSAKQKLNPIDVNEPFPPDLFDQLTGRLLQVQREYERFLEDSSDMKSADPRERTQTGVTTMDDHQPIAGLSPSSSQRR